MLKITKALGLRQVRMARHRSKTRRQFAAVYLAEGIAYLLPVFAILTIICLVSLAGKWDAQEAEATVDLCQEMQTIYKQSNGEYGWPTC